MKLYVGNLSRSTTDNTVRSVFEQFGEVSSVRILFDRETGQSRGFGFVEMPQDEQAKEAMDKLNETEVEGRRIRVNEAREPERGTDRGGRPGGGGYRGGSGGSRGPRDGGGFRSRF
jgi:RNA recognition motif-containing protein